MRIREIREIKRPEKLSDENTNKGFLEIKPEKMTIQEAREFWDNLFTKGGK